MNLTIGDLIALAAVLVQAGIWLATLASLRERVRRLERGAESQGKRLEGHNVRLSLLADRVGVRRRASALELPAVPSEDEPGSDPE